MSGLWTRILMIDELKLLLRVYDTKPTPPVDPRHSPAAQPARRVLLLPNKDTRQASPHREPTWPRRPDTKAANKPPTWADVATTGRASTPRPTSPSTPSPAPEDLEAIDTLLHAQPDLPTAIACDINQLQQSDTFTCRTAEWHIASATSRESLRPKGPIHYEGRGQRHPTQPF